jgi:phosphoribosylamine--glycine ligase
MRVVILGQGGREHALAWRLSLEESVEEILVMPGNPGMDMTPKVSCLPVYLDVGAGLVKVIKAMNPDLVVVGPEGPLCLGIVDLLEQADISVFGPTKEAAKLEGSKIFSKEFMSEAGIPTADFQSFDDIKTALSFVNQIPWKTGAVVKADGLASGKGVIVAQSNDEIKNAVKSLMETHDYGIKASRIIIEERLKGRELSVFALCDGTDFLTLGLARDYKRLQDGDLGPNTGGMGCMTPETSPSKQWLEDVETRVFAPVLESFQNKGTPFKGVLFAGLMVDEDESYKVLEFNVRFGDPETQTLLPLIEGDFSQVLLACAKGELKGAKELIELADKRSVHVVMASNGYPGVEGQKLSLGHDISFEDTLLTHNEVGSYGFMAGVKRSSDGHLVNSGGRVLGITSVAPTLKEAREHVYEALKKVQFEGAQWRKDIGE